jgi:YD repeat-containing protein
MFTFSYSGHGVAGATLYDLAGAHYPDGASESFARDANGNLTNWTDRGDFHWIATYNSRGEPLTVTNPAGGVTTRTYDPRGLLSTESDNAGHTTSCAYDAFGRLTQLTWGDGTNRQFAYDNLDHVTHLVDERGKGWTYDYDVNGRISQATDPLIEHEGFSYDAAGRLTQEIDALGNARLFAYDAAGRLGSSTDRTGIVTQYQYDALGRLARVIDPAGGTRTLSYDGNSRVPAVQDALGRTASFQYDAVDRVTHSTDAAGSGTDFAYDAMGRVLSAAGPLGHTMSMSYDTRGLATAFHLATSETDFGRTALGGIAQVTDPNHNAWPATYDPDGRMTGSADPLARTTAYAYDAVGRLTHATLPLGFEDTGFDAAGRPTAIGYADGTLLTYSWDDANRGTGGSGAAFAYDAAGRMTSSNGLMFARDAEGRITSESYGPAMVVDYAYDSAGRLASVHDWLGGTTSFAYDTTGALILVLRPNGTSAAYQYDAAGRLADLVEKNPGPPSSPALAHIAMTRDALGQPVSIARSQPLIPGVSSASSMTFGYDAASQINGDTHDALGRLVGDGARTFQWDGASRLVAYADGGNAPQYAYDAFDRPLSRTMGASSEQYMWNYAMGTPTLDVVSADGVPKTFYVHTPSGLLLEAIDATAGGRTFYHYDENGNTMFLTDGAGAVQTKYAYSPWGGVTMGGAASDNPFTFGAAAGIVGIGGGLYRTGGGIYDARTARVISGGATASGGDPVGMNPGPPQLGGAMSPALNAFPPDPCRFDLWPPDPCQQLGQINLGDLIGTNQGPPQNGGGSNQPPKGGGGGGKGSPSGPPDGGGGGGGFGEKNGQCRPIELPDIISATAFDAGDITNRPIVRATSGTLLHEVGHSIRFNHPGNKDGNYVFNLDDGEVSDFGKIKTGGNKLGEAELGGASAFDPLDFSWQVSGKVNPSFRSDDIIVTTEFAEFRDVIVSVPSARPSGGHGPMHWRGDRTGASDPGTGASEIISASCRPVPSVSDFCPWCVGR